MFSLGCTEKGSFFYVFLACNNEVMKGTEYLIMNGLTIGKKVKLARVGLGLRQLDVASQANVNTSDVINLEYDRLALIRPFKIEAILQVLGLLEETQEPKSADG